MDYVLVRSRTFARASHAQDHDFSGSLADRFDNLKEQFVDSREKAFATVDDASATFNKWTTDHFALMLLRLVAGFVGFFLLWELYEEWNLIPVP